MISRKVKRRDLKDEAYCESFWLGVEVELELGITLGLVVICLV